MPVHRHAVRRGAAFTSLTVANSTIVGNDAAVGGGIFAWSVTMTNSIVWGNSAEQISHPDADVSYSNVQGGHAGTGNIAVDPGFVDAEGDDFHLAADSPMIDAGNSSLVLVGMALDFEGDPRVVGPGVDIGADEMHLAGDVNLDGSVGVADLVGLMMAWGACTGCPEDIDGNGFVNVGDLVLLVLNWG